MERVVGTRWEAPGRDFAGIPRGCAGNPRIRTDGYLSPEDSLSIYAMCHLEIAWDVRANAEPRQMPGRASERTIGWTASPQGLSLAGRSKGSAEPLANFRLHEGCVSATSCAQGMFFSPSCSCTECQCLQPCSSKFKLTAFSKFKLSACPGLEPHFHGRQEILPDASGTRSQPADGPWAGTWNTRAAAKRAARPTAWRSESGGGAVSREDNFTWRKRTF